MATGLAVASLIGAAAGAVGTGASIVQSKKANKETKKQQRIQNDQIKEQKAVEFEKRKQLIDQQRYNLLGSDNSSFSQSSGLNSGSFSLLGNNQTLG